MATSTTSFPVTADEQYDLRGVRRNDVMPKWQRMRNVPAAP